MSDKSPASLLQELCVKNGAAPEYTFIKGELLSTVPKFEFSVSCFGCEARGEGSSKKEAKQAAAAELLARLIIAKSPSTDFKGLTTTETDSSSEDIKENMVGALQEICMKRKSVFPKYEEIERIGPSHQPRFRMRCVVDPYSTEGEARTKQQAKKIAAKLMLAKLKELQEKEANSLSESKDSSHVDEKPETIKVNGESLSTSNTSKAPSEHSSLIKPVKELNQLSAETNKPLTEPSRLGEEPCSEPAKLAEESNKPTTKTRKSGRRTSKSQEKPEVPPKKLAISSDQQLPHEELD